MVLYLILILGGDLAVLFTNYFMHRPGFTTKEVVIAALVLIPALVLNDGLVAFIVRRLPEKWFKRGVKFHAVSRGEYKFYEKVGIKIWKDHVLELGMFTAFSKKHVADPNDPAYLERFILEANYGAVGHFIGAFTAVAIIFCYPNWQKYFWGFTFPGFWVNFVCSILPYMVLRYNIPRLERMVLLAEKKKARAEREGGKTDGVEAGNGAVESSADTLKEN